MSKSSSAQIESPRPKDAMFLLGIFLVALALRAWAFYVRTVVDFDEMYYYILGHNLLSGRGYTLNGLPHTAFPPLYPLLVGLVALVTDNIRLATCSVSCVAGALLPLPVFFLTRDVYGRRTAIYAAVAATVWPALTFFSAEYVPYVFKLYCGSEPLYITLFMSGAAFLWLFSRHGGWLRAASAGACFGLASLVRSEGPVVFAFLFLWLVIDLAVRRRLFNARAFAQTALVAVAMTAAFSPFLFYLHGVTGRWSLGAKLGNKVMIREALWKWVSKNKNTEFLDIHYRLNDDATAMNEPYWGITPYHLERMSGSGTLSTGFSAIASIQPRWLLVFGQGILRGQSPLALWYTWAFIVAALVFQPWNRETFYWMAFLFSSAVSMAIIAVSLGIIPRNLLYLMPFAAILLARGLDLARMLILRTIGGARASNRLLALSAELPAVVIIALLVTAIFVQNRPEPPPHLHVTGLAAQAQERVVARRLSEILPTGTPLMCNNPWIALWAGLDWRVSPMDTQERIAAYAINRGIAYAVISPWQLKPTGKPEALAPYLDPRLDGNGQYYLFNFRQASMPSVSHDK